MPTRYLQEVNKSLRFNKRTNNKNLAVSNEFAI